MKEHRLQHRETLRDNKVSVLPERQEAGERYFPMSHLDMDAPRGLRDVKICLICLPQHPDTPR